MIEAKVDPVRWGSLKIKAVNLNEKQEAILQKAVAEVRKAAEDDLLDIRLSFGVDATVAPGQRFRP